LSQTDLCREFALCSAEGVASARKSALTLFIKTIWIADISTVRLTNGGADATAAARLGRLLTTSEMRMLAAAHAQMRTVLPRSLASVNVNATMRLPKEF
jgi:hypothetical protein